MIVHATISGAATFFSFPSILIISLSLTFTHKMANSLTAIGLAGNIVQFVSFCGVLLNTSQEIYKSADGALVEYLELEDITTHLDRLTVGMIRGPGPPADSETVRQPKDLCHQCSSTA